MKNLKFVPIEPDDEEQFDIFKTKSKCFNCKSDIEFITYHSQVNGYDNYLGSFPFLDEILLKKYPNYLIKRFSKTAGEVVISNLCRGCDVIQGNFFQSDIWREQHFGHIKLEFIETINVKIDDLFDEEELILLNEYEKEMFLEDNK
ncbi:MAG TPA: hypothetical protein VJB94_03285 [Candidatus Nanoarchaeia archaeon]|nr:hypothetical protein [Candidatus Nanoarchaeia archaeon]